MYDLNVLLNFVKYFVENFCVLAHYESWSIVCCCVLIWFSIRITLASQKEFGSVPALLILWQFEYCVSPSLKVWENSAVKLPSPDLFLVQSLFITVSVVFLVMGLSYLYILIIFNFGKWYVFRNLSTISRFFSFFKSKFHNIP